MAEAVESVQPKLSLSKGPRKLKASEPSKGTSTGGNVWGYKPDLAASSGSNVLSSFATAETAENMSDISGAAAMATGGKVDPRAWLLHAPPAEGAGVDDKGEEYVNLFWLDATENNGVLYLFGKLPVNDAPPAVAPGASQGSSQSSATTASAAAGPRRFVSCCVAVHGCERNLFVLPRLVPDTFKEDGTPARLGMADVYKELSGMLGKPSFVISRYCFFFGQSVKRRNVILSNIILPFVCVLIIFISQFPALCRALRARPLNASACEESTPSSTEKSPARRRNT